MDYNPFQLAARRARLSFPDGKWDCLTVSEQSEAIYHELRSLDAEMAEGRSHTAPRRTVAPELERDAVGV
jgi:hypothetical protein